MEKAYTPKSYENKVLEKWENQKAFLAQRKEESATQQSFTVPIPPPNVTGQLHLGHAMMLVVQDIMTRYHRMKGDASLWLPGTDHAAIATESVVLKNLGVASREEFTREEFLEKCFDHTKKTHATITHQVKKMGASCDFTRERYTMDLGLSNAVWKIFKDLYDHGLIVRGHRMVNWSTGAESVLADDELEYEDQKDSFAYIRCGKFVMGTVRSETKCADSPLVIHPEEKYTLVKFTDSDGYSEEFIFSEVLFDDIERRNKVFNQLDENGTWEKISVHQGKEFEGQEFEYETYAGKRKFFVLCDDEVIDINKGTGAMTISVCHSSDDYLLAKKYPEKLKDYYFEKIGFDGKMTGLSGELEGDEVKKARKRAVKIMLEKNLIVGLERDYVHNVPLCYRTGCVVEPMISPQWFVDVNKEFDWVEGKGVIKNSELGTTNCEDNQPLKTSLKKLTYDAVLGEKPGVELIPNRFNKVYHQWIDNLQDWCISRQIWWGHQIPIWYDEEGNQYVAHEQKILFARHGESEDNVRDVIGGDSSLTENGKNQATKLAKQLLSEGRKISKIYCSSLKRSKETAEIVATIVGNSHGCFPQIEEISEFNEVYTGDLESTPRLINEKYPEGVSSMHLMLDLKTGETMKEVEARAKKFWEIISEKGAEDGDILCIGHQTFTSQVFGVKDGCTADNLLDYRDRWKKMKNGEVREIIWMMKPKNTSNLRQDEDTLDTWFSSALWPFSTLGWPDTTPDFEDFFPTSVLETGHDILFFWVARMIMFSRFATGKNPFSDVYLHGLVCDEHGKKMSKSKGNGIDPLEMIEKFGTDAVRMSLVVGTTPGNQVNLGEKKIEGFRNFGNKLWNISRYILSMEKGAKGTKSCTPTTLPEQWILSKLQTLITEVREGIENHKYGEVGQKLYDFTWNDLADWAIESAKAVESHTMGTTLRYVLETLLKLLHPYMPFITEAIWEELGKTSLLALEDFPVGNLTYKMGGIGLEFEILKNIISKIRSLRSISKVDPIKNITAYFLDNRSSVFDHSISFGNKTPRASKKSTNLETCSFFMKNKTIIEKLARLEKMEFITAPPDEEYVHDIIDGVEIFLPLAGMLDMKKETERKEKELEEAKKQLKNLEGRMSNKKYMDNAPAHLVQETKDQYSEVQKKIQVLEGK